MATNFRKKVKMLWIVLFLTMVTMGVFPRNSYSTSSKEIDIGVESVLNRYKNEILGGEEFLKKAEGVLVFPKVLKAGFGF